MCAVCGVALAYLARNYEDPPAKSLLVRVFGMQIGLWIGFALYGKLDDAAFRKLILVLLLVSGSTLIVAQAWPMMRPG